MRTTLITWLLPPLLACAGACLPEDTRPTPGQLRLMVHADEALRTGFDTQDGFRVRYERVLLSLGNVRLEPTPGGKCSPYTDTFYLRLLDVAQPEPQTLATLFGLGACKLGLQLWGPDTDTLLGQGVSTADAALMRKVDSDMFVASRGSVLYVTGSATKDERTFRFRWSLRQAFDLLSCDVLSLAGAMEQTLALHIRGADLFQTGADAGVHSEVRFAAYAAADQDGDGELTLQELAVAPSSDGDGSASLLERLYQGALPQLVRIGERTPCFVGRVNE